MPRRRGQRDVGEAISALTLPDDTRARDRPRAANAVGVWWLQQHGSNAVQLGPFRLRFRDDDGVGGEPRRIALITGVGRARGIAAAVARRLAASHDLMLSGHPPYDRIADDDGGPEIRNLVSGIEAQGARVRYLPFDLGGPSAPQAVVARTVKELGSPDVLVVAHAHSSKTPLGSLSAGEVDRHLVVNVRATLLLVEAFVQALDLSGDGGRVVLFSSGQGLGAMPDELAYAASKGGVEALVLSLADVLASRGITVNAVNPGPTDTGWISGEEHESIRARFPAGRWGQPEDAARLVAWLVSSDASWVTGQVLNSEGGFRRG